jgi:hypothetical protein
MADGSQRTFRITFWRPWLLAVAMLALPALIAAGAFALSGQLATGAAILGGLAVGAALLALPIGWAVATSRWDVDAAGIGGRDNWHVYRRVRWDEIRSVSRLPLPGYSSVWLNTTGRRWALWVPLFLTDMDEFQAAVVAHASQSNPLRQMLE